MIEPFEPNQVKDGNISYGLSSYGYDIRVAPEFLVEFATAVDRPDADAIFISCGALRSCEVIDEIEQATGKPVVTSNQGMRWHCLRLAGSDDRLDGLWRLARAL